MLTQEQLETLEECIAHAVHGFATCSVERVQPDLTATADQVFALCLDYDECPTECDARSYISDNWDRIQQTMLTYWDDLISAASSF